MSFGKLYSYLGNPRLTGALVVAKENKLDVEIVETNPTKAPVSDDYRLLNKLGKVPTFVGSDGFVLTETIAINIYLASQNEKTALLGKTKQDYASILRWMSFANSELLPAAGAWFRPLLGFEPYNKKNVETAIEKTKAVLKVLDDHFLVNTYLVGERITLADIFTAGIAGRVFEFVFDAEARKEFPNLSRWFLTIANQPTYREVMGEPKLAEKALENKAPAQPKQEKKPAAAPAAAKPKAKPADDEDDDKPAEPKAKHPIDALGRPTYSLDDWKRKYKNEETREVALPYLWEAVNWEEYSVWTIDFKYNEELTMTFMSNNQIGGFFNRLEASRKYLMGCASVYGVTNDSVIKGAFIVRGQSAEDAFSVAPDWESYAFTKLDPKSKADQELVNDLFAWDKPITVNGKEYQWSDGKVFV